MDTWNCPPGFASDRVMLYGDDFIPGSCDVPIALHVALFGALTIVRGILASLQFKVWLDRERRIAARTGKDRKRIPFLPMLSLLSLTALLLFTILTSLNIANGSNGGSLFLLLIYFFPASMGSLVFVARVVNIGKKIIPLAKLGLDGSENEKRLSRLSETTIPLKVFYLLDVMALLITPIGAIMGLAMPVYATFQAAVSGYAAQDVLLGYGLGVQYQRVISAIKACQFNTRLEGGRRADDLNQAIFQLRQQQAALFVFSSLGALLWIVNIVRILLPFYWVVFLQFVTENLVVSAFTLSHARTSCFRRQGIFKGATVTDESSNQLRMKQMASSPQAGSSMH